MVDQAIDILIRFGLDETQAKAAVAALENLKTSTAESSQATAKASDESSRYEETLAAMAKKEEEAGEASDNLKVSLAAYAEETKQAKKDMEQFGGQFVPENLEGYSEGMDKVSDSIKHSGSAASGGRIHHMALHRVMAELNKVSPGLGTSMMMLSRGFEMAGHSAGVASGEVALLDATTKVFMETIAPLLLLLLGFQAVEGIFKMISESAEESVNRQGAAQDKLRKSIAETITAYSKLQEAAHPKEQTIAQKDEDETKERIAAQRDNFEKEQEFRKANEEKLLDSVNKRKTADKSAEEAELRSLGEKKKREQAKMTPEGKSGSEESYTKQEDEIKSRHKKTQEEIAADEKKVRENSEIGNKQSALRNSEAETAIKKEGSETMEQHLKEAHQRGEDLRDSIAESARFARITGSAKELENLKNLQEEQVKNAAEGRALREKLDPLNKEVGTETRHEDRMRRNANEVASATGKVFDRRGWVDAELPSDAARNTDPRLGAGAKALENAYTNGTVAKSAMPAVNGLKEYLAEHHATQDEIIGIIKEMLTSGRSAGDEIKKLRADFEGSKSSMYNTGT